MPSANWCRKEEVFAVLFLDSQCGFLGFDKLFRGSINQSHVPPRAIARRMFELNAEKMVFVHNHPSGSLKPSTEDLYLTKKFIDLFKMLDCQVVDHIIVSPIGAYSFVESGDM